MLVFVCAPSGEMRGFVVGYGCITCWCVYVHQAGKCGDCCRVPVRGSWGDLGGLLKGSWGDLERVVGGTLGGSWGTLGGILGGSWKDLEDSCGDVGEILV